MPNYLSSISDYSNKELINELARREKVDKIVVEDDVDFFIESGEMYNGWGKSTILIINE